MSHSKMLSKMLSNADRDDLVRSIDALVVKIDQLIKDSQNDPNHPFNGNAKILDLLPMLDFYNDDLRQSSENLKRSNFDEGQQ